MKKLPLLLFLPLIAHGQINWKNYSTSFQGIGKEGVRPTLVTAIPYNGRYENGHYGSIPNPGGSPPYIGKAVTYDSGEVYFLAPGLHPANKNQYEYRVIADSSRIVVPWSTVTRFTDPGVTLNEFKDDFGFLGGYKAPWNHWVQVDIREKANHTILSSCIVYWWLDHPRILALYSTQNLIDFVAGNADSAMQRRVDEFHKGTLTLQPGDNTLILELGGDIYRDTAVEYQLTREGTLVTPWRPKTFNNDKLLLQHLQPGSYTLQLRLRAQRHNVVTFGFNILPVWYETKLFKFILGALQTISIGFIILALTLFRQRRKTRREHAARESTQLELRAIRAQLNPHFIFNALGSIQGLVNNNDTDAANRYLSEFGKLLRESLAVSEKDLSELQREIDLLDTYLKLEQLRFGFHYSIEVAPDIPIADTSIPGFLLQPLVENAVKHGAAALRDQGVIRLHFCRQNATFIARIEDNGPGWNAAVPTTGYGLKLTRERIRLLNQLLKHSELTLAMGSSSIEIQFSNWWT